MPIVHDPEFTPDLSERKDFKAYCEAIYAALSVPSSIRGIHLRLGEKARPEWTYSALEYLSDRVDTDRKIPETWFRQTRRQIKPLERNNTAIHVKTHRYARAYPRS